MQSNNSQPSSKFSFQSNTVQLPNYHLSASSTQIMWFHYYFTKLEIRDCQITTYPHPMTNPCQLLFFRRRLVPINDATANEINISKYLVTKILGMDM
jgi:hypothetical protein